MISLIITASRNLEQHLVRCMESVAWQLNPEDELIVVGDGYDPYEGVRDGVSNLTLSRSRFFIAPKSPSVSATRNYAVKNAHGEWLKFLDVDDVLAPFALNAFRTNIASLGSDPLGEKTGLLAGGMALVHNGLLKAYSSPASGETIRTRNPHLISATCIRNAAWEHVDGMDERIEFEEDWDFWLRLRQAGWLTMVTNRTICFYWVDDAERAAKVRNHNVEGVDVREYFKRKYGIEPQP